MAKRCADCGAYLEPTFHYCVYCGLNRAPVKHKTLKIDTAPLTQVVDFRRLDLEDFAGGGNSPRNV